MSENPYEPPKGMEPIKRRTADNRAATIVFSFFAVPAGALAGVGAIRLGSPEFLGLTGEVLLGISAMIAVLIAAHWFLQWLSGGRFALNARGAAIGLAAATPVALITGFELGGRWYDIATKGGESYYLLAA